MGAGFECVFENSLLRGKRPMAGHFSIEVNRHCLFSDICGECFLQQRQAPHRPVMTRDEVIAVSNEAFDCGRAILHFNVAGMEPFQKGAGESEAVIFELLEHFHARPAHRRPLTFNAITSGAYLSQHRSRLRDLPLSSLVVSVDDAASSGLRTLNAGDVALAAALDVRDEGGCDALCVTTVLTAQNEDAVVEIARRVHDAGVDQWMVSPLRHSDGRRLAAVVDGEALLRLGSRLGSLGISGGKTRVLLDVSHDTLLEIAGEDAKRVSEWAGWCWRWPLEGLNVELQAFCPNSKFLRCRWDGELLLKSELHAVGLADSAVGRYKSGTIRDTFTRWDQQPQLAGLAVPECC